MPFWVGEVEVVNDVNIAPSAVVRDGAVTHAGDLTINVNSFFYDLSGSKDKFKGVLCAPVTDNDTNYVYFDGALQINTTGYPPNVPHIRLARVIAQGGVIVRIIHERAFFTTGFPDLDGYVTDKELGEILDGYAALDVKVSVSSNDTTAGFLNGKLVAGTNVTFVENNDGGNETLTISANDTGLDDQVTVIQNALDGYALLLVENQRWIDSTQQRQDIRDALDAYALQSDFDDLDEQVTNIQITLDGYTTTDETVKVSANDTTAGYLNGKLIAGTNVTLTENNDGGNETFTISANDTGLDDQVTVIQNALDGYVINATNIGVGAEVFKQKVNKVLELRKIDGYGPLDVTENTNDITISVDNDAEIWNADRIKSVDVDDSNINDGYILAYNNSSGNLEYVENISDGVQFGVVPQVSFSGSPKTATVTFDTPYTNANYSVSLGTVTTASNFTYSPVVNNKTASSFDISLGSSNSTKLVEVTWSVHGD